MLEEIDDEEMTDSLFRLRAILLAKESELEGIASKCESFLEFKCVVEKFFKGELLEGFKITREEFTRAWELGNHNKKYE